MGRPEKPIDWNTVDKLIMAQNKGTDIAGYFGIHEETFYKRVQEKWGINFLGYAGAKYSEGKVNLRLKNYQKAMDGNVQMLTKLSETYLEEFKEDNTPKKPPMQDEIDKDHLIMELQHKLTLIEDANKSKTE